MRVSAFSMKSYTTVECGFQLLPQKLSGVLIEVPDAEMENLRLQKGDLLVCEGNSADLVGRPAIWNDEIPDCIHQNHILKVRLNEQTALPKFVLEYMQTLPARSYFRAIVRTVF